MELSGFVGCTRSGGTEESGVDGKGMAKGAGVDGVVESKYITSLVVCVTGECRVDDGE